MFPLANRWRSLRGYKHLALDNASFAFKIKMRKIRLPDRLSNYPQIDILSDQHPREIIRGHQEETNVIEKYKLNLEFRKFLEPSLESVRGFLGEKYCLNDSQLIAIIFPLSNFDIQLRLKDTQQHNLVMASASIQEFGRKLMKKLTMTTILKNHSLTSCSDAMGSLDFGVLQESITKSLTHTGPLIKEFMELHGIEARTQRYRTGKRSHVRSSVAALNTMIGMIHYQYGEMQSTEFVENRILNGERGILNLLAERMISNK
ncbi:Hypothetical protein PP7435_CHR2-0567 [Komagataella phaffii CBS 7435]|uniref:Uncharacterized protein n=2 Tax=Komagataella phaffii TaxID=460519 RepID=C4R1I6_KOMPG|nr:Hypothetical protein PAS_chr2-1_0711 [Komagataella phaffii GS115]AOA62823.1 GQ67_00778T0 [Komagataella phaffii]CAH2448109.1 Hypothetical protein BQ9382_C2-3085 [Komagataella phaffii CBS 7435]AOA67649.1 GQ68_00611T0 [Komagataella phaffii GS115]CAY69360.1 Hypothetical protein PAS_chr2-1_0711 [Komagataella phaffii GS115]SCV12034.1 Hypothetical protein PP7435_CHR2-0567 [Komagataella phaffii CBS 7435]